MRTALHKHPRLLPLRLSPWLQTKRRWTNLRRLETIFPLFYATHVTNLDVNECAVNNGNCEQKCVNKLGSRSCTCDVGYEINTDGRTCTGEPEPLKVLRYELIQMSMSVSLATTLATTNAWMQQAVMRVIVTSVTCLTLMEEFATVSLPCN